MKLAFVFIVLFLSTAFLPLEAHAEIENLKPAQVQASVPTKCESVTLAGIDVICLNENDRGLSSRERAADVRTRLQKLSADRSFDTSQIQVIVHANTFVFKAGDAVLLTLTPGELGEPSAQPEDRRAQEIADSMRAAVEADRLMKNPDKVILGALKTLAATLFLAAIVFALRWTSRKIQDFVIRNDGRFLKSLTIQSTVLLSSKQIAAFVSWIARTLRLVSVAIAFYVYVSLVLSFFPWTESWSPKLFGFIVTPILTFFEVIVDYLPNVFFVAVIAIFTRYLLKAIRFIFSQIERGNLQFDEFYPEWAIPTYKLVRVIVVAFAFVMAFPYLPGSNSPAFQGVSVFLGILLSLGSTAAIGNIVAGIVLTYMRPFKVGDRVKISDTIGDVVEKNLLVTRIKSIKHVEITIPNSAVLGSHIVNFSTTAEEQGLILNTTVTIGYDAPWRQVHELLMSAAERTELVDTDHKSFVLQKALNDFFVSYELNVYTKYPNDMEKIYSDLHQNIQDCFNDAGVEIMSPHYAALRDGNAPAVDSKKASEAKSFRVQVQPRSEA